MKLSRIVIKNCRDLESACVCVCESAEFVWICVYTLTPISLFRHYQKQNLKEKNLKEKTQLPVSSVVAIRIDYFYIYGCGNIMAGNIVKYIKHKILGGYKQFSGKWFNFISSIWTEPSNGSNNRHSNLSTGGICY